MGQRFDRQPLINWVLLVLLPLSFACERNTNPIAPSGITGVYTCQESSPHAGVRKYFVELNKVKDSPNLYIISNFHNQGENEFLFAEFNGDTLWITNQALAEFRIEGEGPVGSDFRSIYLYYETDDGTTVLDYYASYTR